jgi:hypothetical protein
MQLPLSLEDNQLQTKIFKAKQVNTKFTIYVLFDSK